MKHFICLLVVLSFSNALASEEKEAADNTLHAINKQFEVTEKLEKYLRSKIPQEYLEVAEVVVPIAETVVTQKITLSWEWK